MIKRHFFLVAAAALLGLMIVAAVFRIAFSGEEEKGGGGGPGGRAQQVQEIAVQPRTFSDRIEVLGVARGRRSVDITSSTTELITRVMFTDGQRVAAGAPLVELQAREEDADILEQRALVAQAQRDFERADTLAERGIAPRVTAEQSRTALEAAQATLRAAQARRGDRVIRAPFAGIVGLSTVTPGTLINPGATIVTLDDIGVARVDFPVPERYLGRLRSGLPITARTDAYGDQTFGGAIALVDTRVDDRTRAVTARAEFPNPGGLIRPGMMMQVTVQQGERQALAAPEAAVLYQGERAFVYRVGREGDRSVAQRVEVQTGAVEGGFVEILSGVSANDRIIASGLNRIQPGATVTTGQSRQGQGGGRGR